MERRRFAINNNNVIIDALGALIVLVLLLTRRRARRDFTLLMHMVHALMLCCVSIFLIDIAGLLLDGFRFPGARALLWVFDTAYWVLHILYCWLWTVFADVWDAPGRPGLKRRALVYALPMLVEMAVIAANPWTGWLFMLDAANIYLPGTAYQLCLLPHYTYIVLSLLLTLRALIASRDAEQKRRSLSLLAYMLLPICGAVLELLAYGVSWVWPMVALSLLMLYLGIQQQILSDEQLSSARAAATAAHLEAKMTNSRMSIMLSQIQPHFLYNALCVIQDLCHGKAPEAEQATIAFSRFLRGNLDSLKADSPISFSQELSHTRHYLTLEQMRFGERLKVEYDIKSELFRLPALTLQPIVENAVRYGVMKKERGGTVRISSAETEAGYVVIVEDDGAGFDPMQKHSDGRTHIGIDNVRQRLREMCGGDLQIRSVRGAGTIAILTLPGRGDTHENSGSR